MLGILAIVPRCDGSPDGDLITEASGFDLLFCSPAAVATSRRHASYSSERTGGCQLERMRGRRRAIATRVELKAFWS
eukprot:scaffold16928_cov34-Tisochrysis_lutea.AAC.3